MPIDFPSLTEGEIYLDSATTSIPPQDVLDAVQSAWLAGGSPGRSVHARGHRATQAYEAARAKVAEHLGVRAQEVVFVPSTTAGLNLVAQGWARGRLGPGDEVLVSVAEHNANFLPWQRVCEQSAARLVALGCDAAGDLCLDDLAGKINANTKVVAINQVSNVTGAVTDVPKVVAQIRSSCAEKALVVVDGAQGMVHLGATPQRWGCDVYTFSGHKCYGVPGAGVVWGSAEFWRSCEPLWVGGGSVERASFEETIWVEGPARFESGTANLPAVAGLVAGLDFAQAHRARGGQEGLMQGLLQALQNVAGLRVLGEPKHRVGCVSWVHEGLHAHDVGTLLASQGIAVRVGHHCAQRILAHFGVRQSVRASVARFNRPEDFQALGLALRKIQERLG